MADIGNFADWMSNLPGHLHKVPLNCLAIPGSHDSFTNFLDKDGPIAPSEPKSLTDLAKLFGMFVKTIIQRWSRTQSGTPQEQLKAGIRYFDIRLSAKAGHEDLYIVHGLYGLKISSILVEIRNFLQEHPKEIVFLDFNHFYDMTPEMHKACMTLIQDTFNEKLCPFLGTESTCLESLWENNLQVLVFYQNRLAEKNMTFWPSSSITSPWPNVMDVDKLMNILETNYEDGRPKDMFYVVQGLLTPDTSFILSHIGGSLQEIFGEKVATAVTGWLKTKSCGLPKGINICMIDFIQFSDFVPVVISLNLKYPELTSD